MGEVLKWVLVVLILAFVFGPLVAHLLHRRRARRSGRSMY